MGAFSCDDHAFMHRAFALAMTRLGQTGANPAVGCVITIGGVWVSEGVTGVGGRPHGEEVALAAIDGRARGATVYVTLEPCRQRSGGSPSCSSLLIGAGISRLVMAAADPHPLGRGGMDRLVAHGVAVEVMPRTYDIDTLYGAFFRTHGGHQGD